MARVSPRLSRTVQKTARLAKAKHTTQAHSSKGTKAPAGQTGKKR